jgi:hypothetical protein
VYVGLHIREQLLQLLHNSLQQAEVEHSVAIEY